MRIRHLTNLFAVLWLAACTACSASQLVGDRGPSGNESSDEGGAIIDLSIRISPSDSAKVSLFVSPARASANAVVSEVETMLGCKLEPAGIDDENYFRSTSCQLTTAKSGMLHARTVSLTRLTEAAKTFGARSLSLRVELPDSDASEILPPAPRPAFTPKNLPEKYRKQLARTSHYLWTDLGAVPPEIRVQYGYRQATVLRAGIVLVGFLLLPLVIVSWLGRRALAAPAERAPMVWFSYMRYLGWTLNLSLVGWLTVVESLHCDELLQFIFSTQKSGYAWAPVAALQILKWCTPVVFWVSCLVLSRPVQEKLRHVSWTQKELALQALYSFCAALIPLAMWIGALLSLSSGAYRTAVLLFVGALFVKFLAATKLAKLMGMQPQALTSGDLRDVAFAIAARLGVKLQQIYLIPSGKGRMANAFARTGNTIAFTDYLLNQMTKREVNFVIAHELTHLQKKHPNKIGGIVAGVAAGLGMVIGMFRSSAGLSSFFTYAAIILASTVVPYIFTRRFEYEADAGAVAATGDPQAAICALYKLAELNLHPLQWSKWSEKWVTHPSMTRRIKAIATRAQIPEASIQLLVAGGVEPALHYAVPGASQISDKVMSTTNRTRTLRSAALALLAAALLPPAICAFVAQILPSFAAHWIFLYSLGLVFGVASHLILSNLLPAWTLRPLLQRMRKKLQGGGEVQTEAWGGIPVGLSPADRPRVYEGLTHWDLGFLFLRSDRICYVGEETGFSLRYDQVTGLQLGPGNPGWLRNRRIFVAWKDEERQTSGVFSIACASAEPAIRLTARTTELFQQLNRWRSARAASRPLPDALAKLEAPQFREVTSHAPGDSLKGRKFTNEMIFAAVLAMAVAILFGLPFHLMPYLNGLGSGARAHFTGAGAGWYVVAAALAVRLFQIAPIFFYKGGPAIAVAATSAVEKQLPRPTSFSAPQSTQPEAILVEKK
jgi:Zn-dependent protease with chaperone function